MALNISSTSGNGGVSSALSESASLDLADAPAPDLLAQQEISRQVAQALCHEQPYPPAPRLIEQGWSHLVPALIELSHHHTNPLYNVLQTIKRAHRPPGRRRQGAEALPRSAKAAVLNDWFYDLLVLLGTLPIESNEVGDRNQRIGLSRYLSDICYAGDAESAISAQSRSEAMLCLDFLCSKIWYARHKEKRDEVQLRVILYRALQYLYWECGVPTEITLMTDVPPDLTDSVYEEVRVLNYRQLYTLYTENKLPKFFEHISRGTQTLKEQRALFEKEFDHAHRRDVRWGRSLSEHYQVLQAKYRAAETE